MNTEEAPRAGDDREGYPPLAVAWYTTGLLAFLYWLSVLDRFIISLLVDPIKRDLGITDVQFGLLHGMAFAVTFALFGLLAGSLADRFSRRKIVYACVTVWSICTALCGVAQQYWHLLVARIGVGVGEAGLNPCATSMISDMFPRSRLTLAMAVYAVGATIGSGCAFLFGGLIVELVSDGTVVVLPLLGEVRPWQATFFVVGVPGLLLATLIFTAPEPVRRERGQQANGVPGGILDSYRTLFQFISKRRFFIYHYLGFGLTGIVVSGGGAWWPAHMARTFGWGAGKIGLVLGLITIVASVGGKLIGGWAVDRLYCKGYRDAQFRWFSLAAMAAAPFGAVAATSADPLVFSTMTGIFMVFMAAQLPCGNAALNLATPNELRGSGVAVFGAVSGLIGLGLGPIVIASISDYIYGGNAIGYGLATTFAIFCPLVSMILFAGRAAMREAVIAQESAA